MKSSLTNSVKALHSQQIVAYEKVGSTEDGQSNENMGTYSVWGLIECVNNLKKAKTQTF